MSVQNIISNVLGQGFAVVPDVVSSNFADRLRLALTDLQSADRRDFGVEYLYRLGQEGFVANVPDRHSVFEELLDAQPLAHEIRELLGSDAVLYLYQGVIVPPGGGIGAYPWKWHCDLYHVTRAIRERSFVPGINMLIYLDDVDSNNGATWLVPGSQGLTDSDLPFGEPSFELAQVQLQASKGTAVLFNPLLWHCAGANTTDRDRCAVKMLSVRGWMIPQVDYARSVRASVQARLKPESLRWLGHASRLNLTFDELEEDIGRSECSKPE